MSPVTEGLLIGVGCSLIAGILVYIAANLARLWHTPKRLDRIEAVLPAMMRALMCVLKNQKEGKCNGLTEDSLEELNNLLTNGVVSQKAHG